MRRRLVDIFRLGEAAIEIVGPLALVHWHEYRHVRVFVPGGKVNRLHAGSAGQPDRRRLLDGARPDVHIVVVVELALEGKGARARPGLDNQVMRLVHTFAADTRVAIVAAAFHTRAPNGTGDNPPA